MAASRRGAEMASSRNALARAVFHRLGRLRGRADQARQHRARLSSVAGHYQPG